MAEEKIESIDGHHINYSSDTGYPTIWLNNQNILVHRYVWEKYHGHIPKGYHIHHKDHNKHNFDISNLEIYLQTDHNRKHALESGLGKSNKGKMKTYASGFCGLPRPVTLYKDFTEINFDSVSEAARFLNIKRISDVTRVARGKRKTVKGWCCRYR